MRQGKDDGVIILAEVDGGFVGAGSLVPSGGEGVEEFEAEGFAGGPAGLEQPLGI